VTPLTPKQELRRSKRLAKKQDLASMFTMALAVTTLMDYEDLVDLTESTQTETKESFGIVTSARPSNYIPEPKRIKDLAHLNKHTQKAWTKAIVKEFQGLLSQNTFLPAKPREGEKINQVMEVFKTKLDKDGLVDKLKARIVFRGDLYHPMTDMDSWNPHTSWVALMIYLAICARYGIYPSQLDFVMAYVQVTMKERVLIRFPVLWRKFLPTDLHHFVDVPLLLNKALYGYTYSGKLLYDEQADFMRSQGFRPVELSPAIWIKELDDNGLVIILQYSDNFLVASTCRQAKSQFRTAISKRFDVEWKERADWYLQARISQDSHKNILIDQRRYAIAIVNRYLPYTKPPTEDTMEKYETPLPKSFVWTMADCSDSPLKVQELEDEFGFKMRAVIGSLNYLANTAFKELYAI
jgi:Reverse transcriptase (RNA-dependent DNA polymerase)